MQRLIKALLMLLFGCGTAYAETIDTRLFKYDSCGFYAVMHINGVDTSEEGAQRNLEQLTAAFGNAYDGHRVRYGLGYNRTLSLQQDVMQAMFHTIEEFSAEPLVTFEDWVRAFYDQYFPEWFPSDLVATVIGRLAAIWGIYNAPSEAWRWEPEVNDMLQDANRAAFTVGSARLVLVGHSQGSIYANMLFRRLTSPAVGMLPGQIGLMSVAAFVPFLEGTDSLHVTNENDRPVNLARIAHPDIIPHTVTIPHTEDWHYEWRGHNFITNYLDDGESRRQIVTNIGVVFSTLGARGPFQVESQYYAYQFAGSAAWRDCTAPVGSPLRNNQCYGHETTMMVQPQIANTQPPPYRPGDRGELQGLAQNHLASCLSLAGQIWQAFRMGDPFPSPTYGDINAGGWPNCTALGLSDILNRFDRYNGADGARQVLQESVFFPGTSGNTFIWSRPMCRRGA